jgi:hypothetical protein
MWPTVSRPIRLGVGHPFGIKTRFFFFLSFAGQLLCSSSWDELRENASVICSAICQWSESQRTHSHTLLSHLSLLDSLSVVSYDSQGLQWKYSNTPPHTEFYMILIYVTDTIAHRLDHIQRD